MVNYGKPKTHKIWSTQGPNIHIGSTTKEYLSQRMDSHRSNFKSSTRKTTSTLVFEEYGVGNCFIELIESKECKNKHEATQLEGHYIRTLDCVNKVVPDRTTKEYREDNKEKFKHQRLEFYEANKDIIQQRQKEYYKVNKDK